MLGLGEEVLERIRYFHMRTRSIIEDWAKKVSHKIASLAMLTFLKQFGHVA
ncbi:MAG: hypothetical protein LM583_09865 [Desulfurococcaceae archaeon]|nr:hypothetical protein [Desulfurococcaceae archaeon]